MGPELREMTIMVVHMDQMYGAFDHPMREYLFLNAFGKEALELIHQHDGVTDITSRSFADLVAWWGAPIETPDHPLRAVQTAEALRQTIKNIHDLKSDVSIGIGINTGLVAYGNVGGHERFDWTVTGNEARKASIIATATQEFGDDILIGENTFLKVEDHVSVGDSLQIHVDPPITVYPLLGLR